MHAPRNLDRKPSWSTAALKNHQVRMYPRSLLPLTRLQVSVVTRPTRLAVDAAARATTFRSRHAPVATTLLLRRGLVSMGYIPTADWAGVERGKGVMKTFWTTISVTVFGGAAAIDHQ